MEREKKHGRAETIRALIRAGKYEFSIHAEKERQADKITLEELEEALSSCKVIEDYPTDPRGASCLVLGFAGERPVHAVCAIKHDPEEVLFITIYDPSKRPEKWSDNYQRRRRQ
ncbi:MAG: DUF4258 domain-containing protein [Deltaproteobacteria bacterium]|nr:DUF4258 domain-containing protein [Deltaproteobacteria bacterium]